MERPPRVAPLVEWVAAALVAFGLIWTISGPVHRMLGPGVEAAIVDVARVSPPGVPPGATSIPVMLLLDGREIRQGDLHTRLEETLARFVAGPLQPSKGEFGDRHARAYAISGTKFFVVCEKLEPNGQMKVSGIYLP